MSFDNNTQSDDFQLDSLLVEAAGCSLVLNAPAKLNLVLRIGGRRDDGFHSLNSLAVRMDFCDELRLKKRDDSVITLKCNRNDLCTVEDNLVYKAAVLLQQHCGSRFGADIELDKKIPDGAGLGGGSADAAVTLAGLNRLWNCGLEVGELRELAAALGSDVALTLSTPACLMSGRGEIVESAYLRDFAAIILCPPIHCATGSVYGHFDKTNSDEALEPEGIDMDKFVTESVSQWIPQLVNDLADAAMAAQGELGRWKSDFEASSNLPVHITGSGSAMFCLFDSLNEAQAVLKTLPPKIAEFARAVRFMS